MADCECIPGCPFFNGHMSQVMPGLVEGMKRKYCKGDKSGCARYMIFSAKGKDAVPGDLIPNQHDRAMEILG